jgi:hypothetical protein
MTLFETESTVSTNKKIQMLNSAGEDYEWYPTTPEIMSAMKSDMCDYLRIPGRDSKYSEKIRINKEYDGTEILRIDSFLDIGAGDGRVLDFFPAYKKYGVEIARVQADDLIRKGVFLVGRNYWDITLINQSYSLIYSNPPFSQFVQWVNKVLVESNFTLLYLVMPVRWKNQDMITKELERYEATIIGEYDFTDGEREARGRVNLVRVNAPWIKIEGGFAKRHCYYDCYQETIENAFERWVREHIADFKEAPKWEDYKEQDQQALALKQTPINQLISDYEHEKENLGAAFKAIGKLKPEIIKLLGQDKKSMLEIIRKSIEGLKSKYWRAAFDKLDPVRNRMTKKTRDRIFHSIQEFNTLDFNADNIYSIVIWIINNANIGILDQIGEVFDDMTSKAYIEAYKSNRHWVKSNWKYTQSDYRRSELPERWKLGLDYRIVLHAYLRSNYVNTSP